MRKFIPYGMGIYFYVKVELRGRHFVWRLKCAIITSRYKQICIIELHEEKNDFIQVMNQLQQNNSIPVENIHYFQLSLDFSYTFSYSDYIYTHQLCKLLFCLTNAELIGIYECRSTIFNEPSSPDSSFQHRRLRTSRTRSFTTMSTRRITNNQDNSSICNVGISFIEINEQN